MTAYLKHTSAKYLQIFQNVLVVGRQSQRAQHFDENAYVETTWIGQNLIGQFDGKVIMWCFILLFHNNHQCANSSNRNIHFCGSYNNMMF